MRILRNYIVIFIILVLGSCKSTITEPKNSPPVINSIIIEPDKPETNQVVKLTSLASDDDKQELSYRWSVSNGALTNDGIGNPIFWSTPNSAGNVTIVSMVYDGIELVTKSMGVDVEDDNDVDE